MIERTLETAGALLSVLSGESQHGRLLRIEFPSKDGPAALLLVNTLTAREELSRCFRFDLGLLSDDARIPLKDVMGRMVTISLVRQDGSLRYFNGYVTEFSFLRTDGGFAFYHMVLEPWLAFAKLRMDNVVFHHQNVIGITETTFAHYRQCSWKPLISGDYPPLTCAIQHNESDYNHVHRRWEELGLHYWYEHDAHGHTLCLSDRSELAEAIDTASLSGSPGEIPFRKHAGALQDDGIHGWQATRQIGSGSMTLASFDYKNPRPQSASGTSRNKQGDVFGHEVYEDSGEYGFKGWDDGAATADRRMQERDARTQLFDACGNDRAAQAGRYFVLSGHFSADSHMPRADGSMHAYIGDRHYLIVSIEHSASNNYHKGPGALSHYENKFSCIRKDIVWRPGRQHNSEQKKYSGVMTALVVGPAGSEVHTDSLGRIRVQFHWDRLGRSDEHSSAWVRVMSPAAGNQFGQVRLPRVGEEVVILFLNGNLDYPIVIGSVYNRDRQPPWQLPEQRVLSGMRTKEFGAGGGSGQRGNHLVFDDTAGQIQAQLKSDHLHSQLSLGEITRITNKTGREDARGAGFELRTDGHGVARAARGLIITTEARRKAEAHITSIDETAQRIAAAAKRHKTLATSAQEQDVANSAGDQHELVASIETQQKETQGAPRREPPFPELEQPHLVLSSAAGIVTTSKQSTHLTSAEHTAVTSGKNLSLTAMDSLFANAANAIRIFVHKAGMRLIAASGKVSIRAQSDDIEAVAHKVLSLISQSDWVEIRGKKGIRLHGADSMLEISDKVQFFTSSPTVFHGNLETRAPKNRPHADAPAPRVSELSDEPGPPEESFLYYTVQAHAGGGRHGDIPYTLYKGDTKIEDGLTDRHGRIKIKHEKGTPRYRVVLGNDDEFFLDVKTAADKTDDSADAKPSIERRQHDFDD